MFTADTINMLTAKWSEFITISVIESTVVFMLVGGLWLLFRRRHWISAQFGYWLFLLILFKLIVPGQISVPDLVLSFLPDKAAQTASGTGMGNNDFNIGKPDDDATGSTQTAASEFVQRTSNQQYLNWRLGSVLMMIWALVVFILSIRLVWVEWKTRLMFRDTKPLDPNTIDVNLERLAQVAGVRQPVRWVTGLWVNSPLAFGLVRPVIAIPDDFSERYTQSQIQWMLLHELAHIKRCDALVSSVQKILQILFFFHPVVWLTNHTIDQLREYACDDMALSGSQASRKDCGEGFLSLIMQANGLPTVVPATLGMIDYKTTIRRRLMRILDNKRLLHNRVSPGSLAFLLALTILICPFGVTSTAAQVGEWMMVSEEGPSPRISCAMTWNSKDNVIIMHGGLGLDDNGDTLNCNDTWSWDGSKWTLLSKSGPGVWGASIAYDVSRGVLVVVGGAEKESSTPLFDNSGNYPNQEGIKTSKKIWEWDGSEWREALDSVDMRRFQPSVAYDPVHKNVVICGGMMWNAEQNENIYENDVWTWDGTELVAYGDAPTLSSQQDMLQYDPSLNQLVLWGWESEYHFFKWLGWNGDGWSQISDKNTFPEITVVYYGACFDTNRRRFIVFTGHHNSLLDDIFELSDEEFSFVETDLPDTRSNPTVCYDPKRKQTVFFGGMANHKLYGDTWTYSVSTSSSISKYLWMQY